MTEISYSKYFSFFSVDVLMTGPLRSRELVKADSFI
jgi:hypothetical protein